LTQSESSSICGFGTGFHPPPSLEPAEKLTVVVARRGFKVIIIVDRTPSSRNPRFIACLHKRSSHARREAARKPLRNQSGYAN
jgi:hypothetical protein